MNAKVVAHTALHNHNVAACGCSPILYGVDAEGSITLQSNQNEDFSYERHEERSFGLGLSDGFISIAEENRNVAQQTSLTNAASEVLAGDDAQLRAEQDINVIGSVIAAGDEVNLSAGRDVNIVAASEQTSTFDEESTKRIGAGFSADSNGVSFFAGSESQSGELTQVSNTAAGSEITGGGNVGIAAGNDINIEGSDVGSGSDLILTAANDINVVTAEESHSVQEATEFERTGLTVGVQHNIGNAIDAVSNINTDNAVSGVSSVLRAVDAVSQAVSGPSFNAGLGTNRTETQSTVESTSNRGSTLGAAGNIIAQAGNNVRVEGSQLNAVENVLLDGRNVDISAAENTRNSTRHTDNFSCGFEFTSRRRGS